MAAGWIIWGLGLTFAYRIINQLRSGCRGLEARAVVAWVKVWETDLDWAED